MRNIKQQKLYTVAVLSLAVTMHNRQHCRCAVADEDKDENEQTICFFFQSWRIHSESTRRNFFILFSHKFVFLEDLTKRIKTTMLSGPCS